MSQEKLTFCLPVRVRYNECDPMGFAHHSCYAGWFEMARIEMLRKHGLAYAEMEKAGIYVVVNKLNLHYRKPAHYDDQLEILTTLKRTGWAEIEHEYEVRRGEEILCTGSTLIACVDRDGKILRARDVLQLRPEPCTKT